MRRLYENLKRHASSLAFVAGFIWDNVMLGRIDHAFANFMLGAYLCLAALCIITLNMHEHRKKLRGTETKYARSLPLILQFCFGSLVSAYIIFYTESASLAVSWLFLLFLVFLVISNELFRKRYFSVMFQLPIFFIVLFSYSIFSLPVLLSRMGGDVFVMSGLASLAGIILLAFLVRFVAPEVFSKNRLSLVAVILAIYAMFNFAYFRNIIPPVPLSLKEIGVYHEVSKQNDGTYTVRFEPGRWYPLFKDTASVYRRFGNEPVYVWSSIFAPTRLSVPIFHVWSYFDEIDGVWVTTDRLRFPITGGRDGGYRGYSLKQSVFPARWRVIAETARGERVGLVEFKVVQIDKTLSSLTTEKR